MKFKLLYSILSIAAVLAVSVLFFKIHPERWMKNGEAPVSMSEIEAAGAGSAVSFAGRKAGPDIPRISGMESMMSLYSWEYFTVVPTDAIPTGVYEMPRWESNTSVFMHRTRTFSRVTTNALIGPLMYNQYYMVKFPDGTYSLALLDANLAAKIAGGEEVTLPICIRSSARTDAVKDLRRATSEYGVSTDNIIYAFDDAWFVKNKLSILGIKIGIIVGLIIAVSVLWVVMDNIFHIQTKIFGKR